MIKINDFAKTKLKNEDLYLFILAIVVKLEEIDPEKIHIQPEFLKLKKNFSDMEMSLYKLPKTIFERKSINMKRKIYASHEKLITYINSFLTNKDENIKVAAENISKVIEDFNILKKTTLDSLVNNNVAFANALSKDEYKPYIAILELDTYLDSYTDLNNSAKELLNKRLPFNTTYKRIRRTELVRTDLERSYNLIMKRLNQLVFIYMNDIYASLFSWWNTYIDDLKKHIAVNRTVS